MPEQKRFTLDCAIVGGGISGLTAAHTLHTLAPELNTRLFERQRHFGGILQTRRENGFLLETSADSFITDPPAALRLCQRLGLADELLSTREMRRGAQVLFEGRLMPIPEGFQIMGPRRLLPLLRSPLLSWKGKLRACCEPWIARRQSAADESLAAFATRRLGKEVFERLVAPLVGGIYTADANQLSMAAALPRFVEMEREFGSLYRGLRARAKKEKTGSDESGARYSLFTAPRGGIGQLLRKLEQSVPPSTLQTEAQITHLARTAEGAWELGVRGEAPWTARHVILATPAFCAADLLEPHDAGLGAELRKIPYASCAVICLAYQKNQFITPPQGFGFVVPRRENRQILAASFASNKFAERSPEDHVLIRVFVGGAGRESILEHSDAKLLEIASSELAQLMGIQGKPQYHEVSRWKKSMPQYHVGHATRVEQIESGVARLKNLSLIGNAYRGVGIPHCIEGAVRATEAICGQENV